MKKANNYFLIVLALLSSAGCRSTEDPIHYVENEDNGLKKVVSLGDMVYNIQYKPTYYIIATEGVGPEERDRRIEQLKGMAWFNISLQVKDYNQSPLRYMVSGLEEYTERQDYYLNKAPKDMYLLYGKDTLYVNSYWFENNQNLSLHETIIVGFKLPNSTGEPQHDLRFSFYDRVFKNGIIKVVVQKSDIDRIPNL